MQEQLLEKLRVTELDERMEIGKNRSAGEQQFLSEWEQAQVRFVAAGGKLEGAYYGALAKLPSCVMSFNGQEPILIEGGAYYGCWLESTGTINTELLSRFAPTVAKQTYLSFATHQREDGLLPYKITENGPAFRQIQLVTPLARSVWRHYELHGRERSFLQTMYTAMTRYDAWLAQWRNTRGTGCVEAFCAYDTGHDLSPRFWHVPDAPHEGDPKRYNPDSPILPFLAPDLTANVYCQRLYLAKMAEELGEDGQPWRDKAEQSLTSLFASCFDEQDQFFYDRDSGDELVRVQSDVLLRVLACEVGDAALFETALKRYLLNTRKFFARYPFPSIALDDPRFEPRIDHNSWAGPTNFLSIIRTPHAFEHHHRYVELTWVMQPLLSAMAKMTRFGQTISPWSGEEGYSEAYSPALLGVIDFVERMCGILERESNLLWFTGLLPYDNDKGEQVTGSTAYGRTVDGIRFELVNGVEECSIFLNGELHIRFPAGVRIVTNRSGRLLGIIGMTIREVTGRIWQAGEQEIPLCIKGNEELAWRREAGLTKVRDIGVIRPSYR